VTARARPPAPAPGAPFLLPLRGPIKRYAWGSRTALAALAGRPPSAEPEAELWLGAHPDGSAEARWEGSWVSLRELIARDPAGMLGASVLERSGPELAFLLKVLAIELPLSLQVHPDRTRASEGFARERAAGTTGEARRYRDPRHKPELVVALDELWALHGLLAPDEIRRRFRDAGIAGLAPEMGRLARRGAAGLRDFVAALLGLEGDHRSRVLDEARAAVAGARRLGIAEGAGRGAISAPAAGPRFAPRRDRPGAAASSSPERHDDPRDRVEHWLGRLLDLHPEDPAALAPLFLGLVRLAPGQGLFQSPGVLHCYLGGAGVEVMASSDNVVRAGLTEKHVDVDEVLEVARFESAPAAVVAPSRLREGVTGWKCDAEEFELVRLDAPFAEAAPGDAATLTLRAALLLGVCVRGEGRLSCPPSGEEIAVRSGAAFAVRPGAGTLRLEGDATLYAAAPRGTAS
jgi:mannose-6-phosphate isomerase